MGKEIVGRVRLIFDSQREILIRNSDQRDDDRQHWTHQSVRRTGMALVLNEWEAGETTGRRDLKSRPEEKING
jgi:hypothetical protein